MTHTWGDDFFKQYGEDLYKAIDYIRSRVENQTGSSPSMKEKWGLIVYEDSFLITPTWRDHGTKMYESKELKMKDEEERTFAFIAWGYAICDAVALFPFIANEILDDSGHILRVSHGEEFAKKVERRYWTTLESPRIEF